jgi:hypothetical protein
MVKKSASFVLASLRRLNVPQGYASPPRLAAAALDDLFDHPAGVLNSSLDSRITFFRNSEMVFQQPARGLPSGRMVAGYGEDARVSKFKADHSGIGMKLKKRVHTFKEPRFDFFWRAIDDVQCHATFCSVR